MRSLREEHLIGLEYLDAVTALMQRRRSAHPTKGSYEAAEVQWWWTVPRRTDQLPQMLWFDDDGRPAAAALLIDFTNASSALFTEVTFFPLYLPDATPEQIEHVVGRGLAYAAEHGFETVELEVDQADPVIRQVLLDHGLTVSDENVLTEAWLVAESRPEVSPLHDGYRLATRLETTERPHHMVLPRRPDIEDRLQQTSLYRPEFDLVVLDGDDNAAAYGMFWLDPETSTGVVEPMRTMDEHQQRGLARHILTSGVDRLARAGAQRISICYEPDNQASGHLYRSVGFEPVATTALYSGPTTLASEGSS